MSETLIQKLLISVKLQINLNFRKSAGNFQWTLISIGLLRPVVCPQQFSKGDHEPMFRYLRTRNSRKNSFHEGKGNEIPLEYIFWVKISYFSRK